MLHNRQFFLRWVNSANVQCWKHYRLALVLQMMVVGLFALTSAILNAVPATAHAEPPDAIIAMLENARRDLEINTVLETRVAAELETLRQSGQAPSDVIADYTAYLERVRAMLAENRRLVKQLESLYLQSTLTTSSRRASEAKALRTMIDAPIPEEDVTDEVTALDRELNASLAEFDDMLLEELKLIRDKSSPKMDALAQEAANAAERLRERGIDIDVSPSETESLSDASRQPAASEAGSENRPTETASGAAGRTNEIGSSATPTGHSIEGVEGDQQKQSERYNGSDDIVARQLREAAEQETDPTLKEKLWQEYEAYKRGGS